MSTFEKAQTENVSLGKEGTWDSKPAYISKVKKKYTKISENVCSGKRKCMI